MKNINCLDISVHVRYKYSLVCVFIFQSIAAMFTHPGYVRWLWSGPHVHNT